MRHNGDARAAKDGCGLLPTLNNKKLHSFQSREEKISVLDINKIDENVFMIRILAYHASVYFILCIHPKKLKNIYLSWTRLGFEGLHYVSKLSLPRTVKVFLLVHRLDYEARSSPTLLKFFLEPVSKLALK